MTYVADIFVFCASIAVPRLITIYARFRGATAHEITPFDSFSFITAAQQRKQSVCIAHASPSPPHRLFARFRFVMSEELMLGDMPVLAFRRLFAIRYLTISLMACIRSMS